jgi:hypothetical protein
MGLKITQVSYRRVANLGNYETVHVEAVAAVNEGEDATGVMTALKEWVEAQAKPKPRTPEPTAASAERNRPFTDEQREARVGGNPAPVGGTGLATPAQLKLIYLTAERDLHITEEALEERCQAQYGRLPLHLTKREASEFIDALKSGAAQQ